MEKQSKHRVFAFCAVVALVSAIGRSACSQAPRFEVNVGETHSDLFSILDAEICRQALVTLPPFDSPTYQPGLTASGAPIPEADLPGSSLALGGLPGGFLPSTRLYVNPKVTGGHLPSSLREETGIGAFTLAPDGGSRLDGYRLTGGNKTLIDACRAAGYR